ncbi:MAG: YggS family pyridoxal phosphate-dependent enzyme [Chloroflexota bacterium]|nr:YggS family pyridoxal phosphate-dependent enzyme [Chloroflexota bacterium]
MSQNVSVLSEAFYSVRLRIESAANRVGRDSSEITLVAVSKSVSLDTVIAAHELGVRVFGESRVQDAAAKFGERKLEGATLHMVGQLQSNKAQEAVAAFDLIESVDRHNLIEALQRYAARNGRVLPVLVQVNTAREARKAGCAPEETSSIVRAVRTCPNLELHGLMTIAPLLPMPGAARPHFRALHDLRDRLGTEMDCADDLRVLSMGMSDDFEEAIEEGATHVRIGRALFAPNS